MVKSLKDVIAAEIERNAGIDQTKEFSVLVKKPGDQGVSHFMSVSKKDLEVMWYKIDHWDQCQPGTKDGLAPREIEALSLIVRSVESGDFAIRQENKLFTKKQGLYDEILSQAQTIEKAESLAQRKFIGRDEQDNLLFVKQDAEGNVKIIKKDKLGNVEVIEKSAEEARRERVIERLEGVYNVLDESKRNVNDMYDGQLVFDEEEYAVSVGDEMNNGNMEDSALSEEFVQATLIFNRTFNTGSFSASETESEVQVGNFNKPSILQEEMSEWRNDLIREGAAEGEHTNLWDEREEARESLRVTDLKGEEHARLNDEKEERLKNELDEKHQRILSDSEHYFQRKNDHKKAA